MMSQKINHQSQRARRISVAVWSDVPEEWMFDQRHSQELQPNENIGNLHEDTPRGTRTGEQIINAYKLMQRKRQSTQYLTTSEISMVNDISRCPS